MTENKHQSCCVSVSGEGQWGAFHPHMCRKNATVEINGKWYCTIHNPKRIESKTKAKIEAWDKKYEIRKVQLKLESTAVNSCKSINPSNPQIVAESIEEMYEAIKCFVERTKKSKGVEFSPSMTGAWIGLTKVLNKLEGK